MKSKWLVYAKKADFKAIEQKYGIDQVIARIMRNRDVCTDEEMQMYLNGSIDGLHAPELLKDAQKAVDILTEKIAQHKKIRIIGDYDIDRHRGVILHPAQPFVAQEPAKDTTRKGAVLLLVSLVLLPLKAPGGFPAHVRQNLHTGLPAQEIIVILIFVIDGQQGLDVHVPVTRAEQTPEFCRYLI